MTSNFSIGRFRPSGTKKAELTIGTRLYLSVLSLFVVFAVAFIVFQQNREKQFKVETLNTRLQDFNTTINETVFYNGDGFSEQALSRFIARHHERGLRVTIIRSDGTIAFDNIRKDYVHMGNHLTRPEVVEAMRTGTGSAVDRNSTTLRQAYFYSATYFPKEKIIIRSALPYNVNLAKSLRADQHYIWFAIAVMVILTIVLFRFTHRLGRNITKLNAFATRVEHTASVPSASDVDMGTAVSELGGFSDDELGDTAERIVKLYIKLQRTQKEQDILKRQLTQNVAHELKTPVASIQGYLETILSHPDMAAATRDQFLDRCYSQSKRLASLLGDMSTLNRMDDGADMMVFEDVDVAEVIRTVEKESQFALEEKNMSMECHIPDTMVIHGNRGLIYSIFRNLTDNAIAYAGTGVKITVDGSLRRVVMGDAAGRKGKAHKADAPQIPHGEGLMEASFVFSDNGIGVADEHLPRLFERFYRVDKGRSRKMGGTGLGLAIVKNAVRVHGGAISVRNNPGGGLRFEFTLR